MKTPTTLEAVDLVAERFGMSRTEVCHLLRTPTHPREMRDDFARRAMQGLIVTTASWADLGYTPKDGLSIAENYAVHAYEIADAMLEARGK